MTADEKPWRPTLDESGDVVDDDGCNLTGGHPNDVKSLTYWLALDLPDGVSRLKSGELVAFGQDVPEGWTSFVRPSDESPTRPFPGLIYFVHPPEEPKTERVPWHELVGRKVPGGGTVTSVYRNEAIGLSVFVDGIGVAAADEMEVLVED